MNLLTMLKSPAARVPAAQVPGASIVDLPDPDEVIIALEYPGRIRFLPEVRDGETVARNQVIARSAQGNCLHASVSGTVKEIRPIWSATSDHVPAVVITRGEGEAWGPRQALARCGLDLRTGNRIDLLRAGGVVSPWTTPGRDDSESELGQYPAVEHLVLCAVNQEPTTVNYELLLRENADAVREGLHRLREITPNVKPQLLIAASAHRWAQAEFADTVDYVPLPPDYRRRIRRLVIPRLVGRSIPSGDAFRSHGVASLSVEQLLALTAALDGRPFVSKTVSVASRRLEQPVTVRVPLGTPVGWILSRLGLELPEGGRVILGGPMRGYAHFSAETPISKFENGILLLERDELPSEVNLTCINCGLCTRACPVNLQVHLLGRYVEFGALPDTVRFRPGACLECGLCGFVCPAHRPLVQLVKMAKKYGG